MALLFHLCSLSLSQNILLYHTHLYFCEDMRWHLKETHRGFSLACLNSLLKDIIKYSET